MKLSEAKRLIEELRGRFESPFSSKDKETIERLYLSVCGKRFVPTSCQQCYHDTLIEIICYIKKNRKMKEKCKFVLKAGAIINSPNFENGKVFCNDNMTDDVARKYLAKYPGQVVLFQKLPEGYKPGEDDDTPTLEEAEAMLEKAEEALEKAKEKVSSIQENIENADTDAKKEKARRALEKAQKAVEKAKKDVDETAELVAGLKAAEEE